MNQQQYQPAKPAVQPQPQPQPQIQVRPAAPVQQARTYEIIFCSTCGQQIAKVALACPFCGAPVYQNQPQQQQPQQIIINNSNNNANVNTLRNGGYGSERAAKNKWTALLLCIFLGGFGAHKFYEGKILLGIIYLLTLGFGGIGIIIDFFALLFKPNPYYP